MKEQWKSKLDDIIYDLRVSTKHREYDINGIFRMVGAPTVEDLALELTERIQKGELKATYRILSRQTRSGIEEYQKFSDIPDEVYDKNVDETFHVEPYRDLEIVYQAA